MKTIDTTFRRSLILKLNEYHFSDTELATIFEVTPEYVRNTISGKLDLDEYPDNSSDC